MRGDLAGEMKAQDHADWLNRSPRWPRMLLFLALYPFMLAYSIISLAVIVLFVIPIMTIKGKIEHRRFWRKLREQGRVVTWPEVEEQVCKGEGTLVVEITPKGPGYSWLIDRRRVELDPDCVVPSWRDIEERGWEVFRSSSVNESIDRWTSERLGPYATSARALIPTWSQLTGLKTDAKRESVLGVLSGGKGTLSRRCW